MVAMPPLGRHGRRLWAVLGLVSVICGAGHGAALARPAAPGLQLLPGAGACVGSAFPYSVRCATIGDEDPYFDSVDVARDGSAVLTRSANAIVYSRDPVSGRLGRPVSCIGGGEIRGPTACLIPPIARRLFPSGGGLRAPFVWRSVFDPTARWIAAVLRQDPDINQPPEQDVLDAVQLIARDPSTGTLTPADCIAPDGAAGCAAAPGMHWVDQIDVGAGANRVVIISGGSRYGDPAWGIHWLLRDPETGTLVQRACLAGNVPTPGCPLVMKRGPIDWPDEALIDAEGRVWMRIDGRLDIVEPDFATGSWRRVACYGGSPGEGCPALPGLDGVSRMALMPDGRWLYGTAVMSTGRRSESRIVWWAIGADGALQYGGCRAVSGSPCSAGGRSRPPAVLGDGLSFDGGGRELTVISTWRDHPYLGLFSRDPVTGDVSPAGCLTSSRRVRGCARAAPLWDADNVRFAPDGRTVYFSAASGSGLFALGRGLSIDARPQRRRRVLSVPVGCPSARAVACRGTLLARWARYPIVVARRPYRLEPGAVATLSLRSRGRPSWCSQGPRVRLTATDDARLVRPVTIHVTVSGC